MKTNSDEAMLIRLIISAFAGFLLITIPYTVYGGRSIVTRLDYAVFMGVVPAIAAAVLFKMVPRLRSSGVVELVYPVLFAVLWVAWARFHG